MKNSIIIETTNDKYEFIINIYNTTKELAKNKKIPLGYARRLVNMKRKNKTNFYRIWLNKGC